MTVVCLYISVKYQELQYPVINDICKIMALQIDKKVFEDMERAVYAMFDWDLEVPTLIDCLNHIMAQGTMFTTDSYQNEPIDEVSTEKLE